MHRDESCGVSRKFVMTYRPCSLNAPWWVVWCEQEVCDDVSSVRRWCTVMSCTVWAGSLWWRIVRAALMHRDELYGLSRKFVMTTKVPDTKGCLRRWCTVMSCTVWAGSLWWRPRCRTLRAACGVDAPWWVVRFEQEVCDDDQGAGH